MLRTVPVNTIPVASAANITIGGGNPEQQMTHSGRSGSGTASKKGARSRSIVVNGVVLTTRYGGGPTATECANPSCSKPPDGSLGLCKSDYSYFRRHGTLVRKVRECDIDGCYDKHKANGMCAKHYFRWYNYGTLELRQPNKSHANKRARHQTKMLRLARETRDLTLQEAAVIMKVKGTTTVSNWRRKAREIDSGSNQPK